MSEVGIFRWEISRPRRSGRRRLAAAGPRHAIQRRPRGQRSRTGGIHRREHQRGASPRARAAQSDRGRRTANTQGELVAPRGAGMSARRRPRRSRRPWKRTLASCTCPRSAPGSAPWPPRPPRVANPARLPRRASRGRGARACRAARATSPARRPVPPGQAPGGSSLRRQPEGAPGHARRARRMLLDRRPRERDLHRRFRSPFTLPSSLSSLVK
jgi:hypothetical protein